MELILHINVTLVFLFGGPPYSYIPLAGAQAVVLGGAEGTMDSVFFKNMDVERLSRNVQLSFILLQTFIESEAGGSEGMTSQKISICQ